MRIVSGIYRGRTFKGKAPAGVRPTQDAMRETIFNILRNYIDFEGIRCADICSGTGAMGFEALSRGAEFVYFVDKSRQSMDYLKQAAGYFNVPADAYKCFQKDAVTFVKTFKDNFPNEKLDLLITDPPYACNIASEVVQFSFENEIISDEGILVAEYGKGTHMVCPEGIEIVAERIFAAAQVSFFRKI